MKHELPEKICLSNHENPTITDIAICLNSFIDYLEELKLEFVLYIKDPHRGIDKPIDFDGDKTTESCGNCRWEKLLDEAREMREAFENKKTPTHNIDILFVDPSVGRAMSDKYESACNVIKEEINNLKSQNEALTESLVEARDKIKELEEEIKIANSVNHEEELEEAENEIERMKDVIQSVLNCNSDSTDWTMCEVCRKNLEDLLKRGDDEI